MVKLIIQIPCYNEESTLPQTLNDLPKQIRGIDLVETLVIDDGSTDRTYEVAKQHNVHHILRFKENKGLVHAFKKGLDECLRLGADIIVNTDGDNQYWGKDVIKLVTPILENRSDIVIGVREIDRIRHFSWIKKKLQKVGSWVVRKVSNTDIEDTTSGFRAFNRKAALELNIISTYTYTLESIILAEKKKLLTQTVPVKTNEKNRESRLIKNIPQYIFNSAITIFRIFVLYNPLKSFLLIGSMVFSSGILAGILYLALQFYFMPEANNIASLILCAILLTIGFQIFILGILSDLVAGNRIMVEELLLRIKKMEFGDKMDRTNPKDKDER